MPDIFTLENKIKEIIDRMKGICHSYGLANSATEEEIITSVFLYKFLNDKFNYNLEKFAEEYECDKKDVLENKDDLLDLFYDSFSSEVAFAYDATIEKLLNDKDSELFYKIVDDALESISNNPRNEKFRVKTADGNSYPLFIRITEKVEFDKKNDFAKSIFSVISQEKFDFTEAFTHSFDFYSTIFEYLIKDYNVASGIYAEYFTPQAISSIIGDILVGMSPVEDKIYEIYDPSAGSGSLVLHLANSLGEGKYGKKAKVYTQDIAEKSSRFLRLNLMLNGLANSLENVIKGDTLDNPAHFNIKDEPTSGIKKFDYITSNPPFKTDFSSTRDKIEHKWSESEIHDGITRFFAGIPKIPKKKKESMGIYLCFIQHILYSLKEDGKAAIVVPTGFITAQSGIERKIRETIIERKWLKGVISMPSNIFANTGTNVSVIFIDKSNTDGQVLLMDASKLGEKKKDGKNQRTVLSDAEILMIKDTFIKQNEMKDFSIKVTYDDIKEKNYSFSAGQYFPVEIEYVDITQEEYDKLIEDFNNDFNIYVQETLEFQRTIKEQLVGLKIVDNREE